MRIGIVAVTVGVLVLGMAARTASADEEARAKSEAGLHNIGLSCAMYANGEGPGRTRWGGLCSAGTCPRR